MRNLKIDEAIRYEDEAFTECRAVKLFFLYRDRNAWHETRSTRYSEGCMTPSFESTRLVAEKMRRRGTVFYIEEISALQFLNSKLSMVVTEINTEQPLQYIQDISEGSTIPFLDIYEHFSTAKINTIIKLIWLKSRSRNLFEALQKSNSFKRYRSYPKGANCSLGWQEVDHKMSSSAVGRLSQSFDRVIETENRKAYQADSPELTKILQTPTEELVLSVRLAHDLKNAGIRFVGDLIQFTELTLKREIENNKSINEIEEILAGMGVALKSNSYILDKSVDDLELSVRTANVLHNAQLLTIGDLIKLNELELIRTQNMGRKSINELKNVLSDFGLTFAES